jgi:hypothetical protein
MSNIRKYGPGKFNTILDSYVYGVSVDGGCDEEFSHEYGGGWYGMMRHGRTIFRDHDPFLEPLNDAEREQLTECAGVILYEDSQGFVYVDYYDTDEELQNAWHKIAAQFETDDTEGN